MRETQQARVLNYLMTHKTMTRNDAVRECGCHKLPTVVGELKRKGYRINGEMTKGKNRFGEDVRYMTYWMDPEGIQNED